VACAILEEGTPPECPMGSWIAAVIVAVINILF
jgi:hypothetical protein